MQRLGTALGLLVVMVTIAAVLFAGDYFSNSGVAVVRKRLTEIPGVHLTYISDLDKQASQAITAYLEVPGKGEIGFTGLDARSFGHASHVYLHGIGLFRFRTRALVKGSESYGYTIDIGTASPVPAVRRMGITNVQSAVAQYDALIALVAHWPVTTGEWPNRWPAGDGAWTSTSDEEIHFPDAPRGDYYVCLNLSDTAALR